MSIVPVNTERGVTTTTTTNSSSGDLWDVPEDFLASLDLWDPYQNFPFPSMLSTHFPSSIFPYSRQTHVNRRETPRAHVFRAVFPGGSSSEDVLVYIDDDNMLQISTEDGSFLSKFKLPENAKRDEIKASMVNGVLTVTVPKVGAGAGARQRNVRVVDITGSG
uniref:18.5 kDa class I heat shock protein-like n=1 Tax=Rhizophora mucronata TaxID=61149 RepID=A0A2P2QXT1_RHIMU